MTALPTFRTWVAGEVVTAAYMNSNIRDSGNFFLAQPIAELRQTIAQSIPTGVFTPLLFDTEDIDSAGGHSTVTNTSRYTATYSGWYQLTGGFAVAANATGRRGSGWMVNGSVVAASVALGPPTATLDGEFVARTKHQFLNGSTDYAEFGGYQESGGALSTAVSLFATVPSMGVRWVSS